MNSNSSPNNAVAGPSVKGELRDLYTPYATNVDNICPLPEYPRPQLKRAEDSWTNLNGLWRYAIRKGSLPEISLQRPAVPEMDGEILVPFSPEALLSGVQRRLLPDEVLWYEKDFDSDELPCSPKNGRILLHFGAVDQSCRVFLNNHYVGANEGGYFSFSFDLSSFLIRGKNRLHVAVVDPSQTGDRAYGKQSLARGKIWYSPSSGIWQTVWLEAVPAAYVSEVKLTPDLAAGKIKLSVVVEHPRSNAISAIVASPQRPVTMSITQYRSGLDPPRLLVDMEAELPAFRPWTPEDPYLYSYELQCGEDTVQGYFAMRSFGLADDAKGIPRLTLNGRPYAQVGVLDQGYWSDGMYTAPTDQAMIDDITAMKNLGFNMLRKHIKIESARWYYHCDRLGMLVWQDLVSGGGPYKASVIAVLPFLSVFLNDTKNYKRFGRATAQSRECFEDELERTLAQLYSVPSIALWVPFNEGWGQFDAARIGGRVKALDPTRPVDHASGWHDQGAGDLKSRHVYLKKIRLMVDRLGRPQALTEFGGYTYAVPDHSANDKKYGYKPYQTLASYQQGVIALFDHLLSDRARPLAATVYTQVSDVEDELNGLLTYDRQVSKWPDGSPAARALKERLEALKEI